MKWRERAVKTPLSVLKDKRINGVFISSIKSFFLTKIPGVFRENSDIGGCSLYGFHHLGGTVARETERSWVQVWRVRQEGHQNSKLYKAPQNKAKPPKFQSWGKRTLTQKRMSSKKMTPTLYHLVRFWELRVFMMRKLVVLMKPLDRKPMRSFLSPSKVTSFMFLWGKRKWVQFLLSCIKKAK